MQRETEAPLRVLVISSYDDAYNAVRPEGELFIGLHRAGVEVTVMTQGHTAYARRFREQGIRVIDYHPPKKYSRESVAFIRKELEEKRYHLLHLFNKKAIINGIAAARRLPVKVVLYRGYVGNIHWYDPTSYLSFLHPRVDAITCAADSTRDFLRRQLLFHPEKAVTVRKGHDPAWYKDIRPADRAELGLPESAFTICCLANARPMKGVRYLIEATHYLPVDTDIHFLLIGRDMSAPHLKKAMEASPYRERFHLPGYRTDALELLAASDVFVLSSIKGEGTPKAVVEAMNLGIPPIITAIPGNANLVTDKVSGLVVPPRDARAIAAAITHLWSHREALPDMSRMARQHIAERLHIDGAVREMKALYEQLVHAEK